MFYKLQAIKRLLKAAYKESALVVGQTEEGWLYTSGSYWILVQDIKEAPKEFRAAIIELAGELPNPGEVFRAGKYGNQMEIENRELYALPQMQEALEEVGDECRETGIIINMIAGKTARLFIHNRERIGTLVDTRFAAVPDPEGIEYEKGETDIEGPLCSPDKGWLVWHNDSTWYAALPIKVNKADEEGTIESIKTGEEICAVGRGFGLLQIAGMKVES